MYCQLCAGVASIRLQQILVAHQVGRGEDVQLRCHFLLEGHTLYSVKWFKGSHEFFRYAPKETPAKKVFLLNELTVDVNDRCQSSEMSLLIYRFYFYNLLSFIVSLLFSILKK